MTEFNFNKTQFEEEVAKNGSTILFKKISSDLTTPVQSSIKIFKKFPNYHFLLESAQNGKDGKNSKGRFSVIGIDPDKIWKCENEKSFLNENFSDNQENFKEENGDILQNFRNFFNDAKIDFTNLTYQGGKIPAICAGVFGYFGYDMVNFMEKKLPKNNQIDETKIPDAIFTRPQILIIFDNFFDIALICAPVFKGNKKSYQELTLKINQIHEILQKNIIEEEKSHNSEFNFTPSHSQEEYHKIVNHCKKYITDGDIFQILPSQRFTSDFDKNIEPFNFYRSLRSLNPSPFLFFFKFQDFVLTGSSPEIMVSLKDKVITIRPLAGTRKRGKNKEEDEKIAAELLRDEKEIAEHLMLIDLGRHDVGKVAKTGSVKTTQKMIIEYYSHVMHISSNVCGEIRDEFDALDALISGFPAGTVSGAPKIRALEILSEIEKIKRSFYAGCAGYFSSNGDMESCIILRSALIKDEKIYLQAGAGVVFDSNAESEYQECHNKAQALIKALTNLKQ